MESFANTPQRNPEPAAGVGEAKRNEKFIVFKKKYLLRIPERLSKFATQS